MTLLLFLYFSLLFLYFCTTFSSIGTSNKKVQTFILFLVLVEQKVLLQKMKKSRGLFFIFCNSTYIFVHSIRKLSNRSCQTVILTYVSMYYYAYAMLCHKKTHFLLISGYTSDLSTH